jgi:hypothetical protein
LVELDALNSSCHGRSMPRLNASKGSELSGLRRFGPLAILLKTLIYKEFNKFSFKGLLFVQRTINLLTMQS